MGTLKVDKIVSTTGNATSAPITLSGDTATLGTGVTIPATGITGTLGSGVTIPAAGITGTFLAASRPGVRQFIQNTTETETDGTFAATTEVEIVDMKVAITPTATDSRFLVTFSCGGMSLNATFGVGVHIKRITGGVTTMARKVARYVYKSDTGNFWHNTSVSVNYLDTPTIPSTPIEIVYQMYIKSTQARAFEMNPNSESASDRAGVVTVMELAPN
jgi:hypothetical protein